MCNSNELQNETIEIQRTLSKFNLTMWFYTKNYIQKLAEVSIYSDYPQLLRLAIFVKFSKKKYE